MEIQDLTDSEIKELIGFKVKKLKDQLKKAEIALAAYGDIEETPSKNFVVRDESSNGKYDMETTLINKIKHILLEANKVLTSKKIREAIQNNEKRELNEGTFSGRIGEFLKAGKIKKHVVKGQVSHFYGLPKWFDEDILIDTHNP